MLKRPDRVNYRGKNQSLKSAFGIIHINFINELKIKVEIIF